ncbi:MAG: nucleotide-binding protein [Actinomycetota bacterium]
MNQIPPSDRLWLVDRFHDDQPAGQVIGSTGLDSVVRRGVDCEGRIGIDNQALRIRPLDKPGWGRQGVCYGPFERAPGLTFAVHVLNGHNCSQTFYLPEAAREKLRRWLCDARKLKLGRRARHHENLAVGWFPYESPSDPVTQGNGFIMHASLANNGELWAGVKGGPMTVVHGVDNLPIIYMVVLRELGAAYYASSVPGANGMAAHPRMRPLAIDCFRREQQVYGGVHQRILGEVGYSVDTRVYGVFAGHLPQLSRWYGTAHLADSLSGEELLDGSLSEVGGLWQGGRGELRRSVDGAFNAAAETGHALLFGAEPAGLLHAIIRNGRRVGAAGLIWRAGIGTGWKVLIDGTGCTLFVNEGTGWQELGLDRKHRASPGSLFALQILDDGDGFGLFLDGVALFEGWFNDSRMAGSTGCGIALEGGTSNCAVSRFEVHPRQVEIPSEIDLGVPWSLGGGNEVFTERFDSVASDLHGVSTPSGGRTWERTFGRGTIELTKLGGARVKAEPSSPNPDRTFYTVPWDTPGFVDLTLEMTPPGTERHQGHRGRGGMVFWQDPENYLVVNVWLDDSLNGTSISTFYHLAGKENMYDAVWTLTGSRVSWGLRCALKVVFDGTRFIASLNNTPSLVRALKDVYPDTPDLAVNRVGLIANEEWGNDTGTMFHSLTGRGPA